PAASAASAINSLPFMILTAGAAETSGTVLPAGDNLTSGMRLILDIKSALLFCFNHGLTTTVAECCFHTHINHVDGKMRTYGFTEFALSYAIFWPHHLTHGTRPHLQILNQFQDHLGTYIDTQATSCTKLVDHDGSLFQDHSGTSNPEPSTTILAAF
ncbi:MAG: hypothetical protein ACP5VQ_09250, partial [Phycisphaerae bacterium]